MKLEDKNTQKPLWTGLDAHMVEIDQLMYLVNSWVLMWKPLKGAHEEWRFYDNVTISVRLVKYYWSALQEAVDWLRVHFCHKWIQNNRVHVISTSSQLIQRDSG